MEEMNSIISSAKYFGIGITSLWGESTQETKELVEKMKGKKQKNVKNNTEMNLYYFLVRLFRPEQKVMIFRLRISA